MIVKKGERHTADLAAFKPSPLFEARQAVLRVLIPDDCKQNTLKTRENQPEDVDVKRFISLWLRRSGAW